MIQYMLLCFFIAQTKHNNLNDQPLKKILTNIFTYTLLFNPQSGMSKEQQQQQQLNCCHHHRKHPASKILIHIYICITAVVAIAVAATAVLVSILPKTIFTTIYGSQKPTNHPLKSQLLYPIHTSTLIHTFIHLRRHFDRQTMNDI